MKRIDTDREDLELFPFKTRKRRCECCRHFGPCAGKEHAVCRRCTQCGEWCASCGQLTLLDEHGLCETCSDADDE